jgi:Pvc16 N-terminal domain
MSNALAIASVTRVLQDLLNNGIVDNDVVHAIGGNVIVSALPPDRINGQPNAAPTSQLNLFLHQVRPNLGWRNADLPTRSGRNELVNSPLLPLNLHYLLTAYGAEELHSEILLGYAMLLLHENAILGREAIRTALEAGAVDTSVLPPAFQAAAASELADQVELIKITPENLSTDDMSKLWTALQTHYRPTVAYEVSVVLIESQRSKRTALPVLTRGRPGPDGREPGVAVQPNLLPPYPTLETLTPEKSQPAIRMGETLTLAGHHLAGDQVFVRFTEPKTGLTLRHEAAGGATATLLKVTLPPPPPPPPVPPDPPPDLFEAPDNWRAGAYGVTVLVQKAGEQDRVTNELPVILAPTIVTAAAAIADGVTTFTIKCTPKVTDTQRVSLIVGEREISAEPIGTPPTDTLQFKSGGFGGGTFLLRLRVDGAESIFIDRSVSPPTFIATEKVDIP